MEDENELELSLGLSFGGSSGKSRSKTIPSDSKVEEGSSQPLVRDVTISDVPFKNFFENNTGNQDQSGKQGTLPPQETLWTDIGKSSASTADCFDITQNRQPQFARHKDLWLTNSRTTETEEEKSGLKKRRFPSEEINFQKRHEKVVDHAKVRGKALDDVSLVKHPHLVAVGDGSTGENEDVAESEAEVSSSWLVPQHAETTKRSDHLKDTAAKHASSDSTGIVLQGQKQQNYSGNMSIGELVKVTHDTLQPLTVSMVPYPVPKPTVVGATVATSRPPPRVVQQMLPSNDEHPMVHGMDTSSQKLVFGYSSIKLPTLETNSSWAFGSQPQVVSSLAAGTTKAQPAEDETNRSNVPVQIHSSTSIGYEKNLSGLVKGNGKHAETGTSSSSHAEEDKGISTILRLKETANPPVAESFPHDGSAIKPGAASNIKFGGCGSFPDLPWVSTTGPGAKGKTISGVTYKYSKNQIKIVCACHGSHLSPEEFIQHARGDATNPENNTSLASFTSSPSGSAQN